MSWIPGPSLEEYKAHARLNGAVACIIASDPSGLIQDAHYFRFGDLASLKQGLINQGHRILAVLEKGKDF